MFIVRDIFQLKFGHYKNAKVLLDEAAKQDLLPVATAPRVLSDFTGDAYRLIFEEGFDTLAAYERSLTDSMGTTEWKNWYDQFKEHVVSSHREILKQVL